MGEDKKCILIHSDDYELKMYIDSKLNIEWIRNNHIFNNEPSYTEDLYDSLLVLLVKQNFIEIENDMFVVNSSNYGNRIDGIYH